MRTLRAALITAGLALCALAVPALAGASTLYVSNNAPSAPFNSCAHPNYNSVQKAVEAPSTAVKICPGTYNEQVQITKAVNITAQPGATLQLPALPVDATTVCDKLSEEALNSNNEPYGPNQDELSVCTSGTVSITGLKIKADWPAGTCNDNLYGLFAAGGVTLNTTNVTWEGAGDSPINGCQGGVAAEIGTARTEPSETARATFTSDTVSGYQKNGITDEGAGTDISVSTTTVTGAGPTAEIGQNGIQVSYGAGGTITKSTITGNECNNASCSSSAFTAQATGVLFYGAAKGSSVTKSHINGNDVGILSESSTETEPTEPTAPQIQIKQNILENDRYAAVQVWQGWDNLTKDTLKGGNVGIQLVQDGEEAYGPKVTATKEKISGMTVWGVQGLSDEASTDPFGSIAISKSHISGNPGPTVAESVNTNNPAKLKIYLSKDS